MYKQRYWVQYESMWTHTEKVTNFDTKEEAEWFAKQVNVKILDWK